jgi:hypothetical protein
MTVVICTHERIEITSLNIESLLGQCHIVLVVSTDEEKEHYSKYPITIVKFPNIPLGAKWQKGVSVAREIGQPVVILGSDDILEPGTIGRYKQLIEEGNTFIGLSRWWQHHQGKAYLCDYLASQPLGGGRCYSKSLLDRCDWGLFHPKLSRHLDDLGWKIARGGIVLRESLIHAVKGNWKKLNEFNPNHRNVRVLSIHDSKDILPIDYDRFGGL